jgi:hypothetical protein
MLSDLDVRSARGALRLNRQGGRIAIATWAAMSCPYTLVAFMVATPAITEHVAR